MDQIPILSSVLDALQFAAEVHKFQRRNGYDPLPYINHLIKVTRIVHTVAGYSDPIILSAAALHDVIEDSEITEDDLARRFGPAVAAIVAALTDDMSLPYEIRRQKQLEGVVSLPSEAKVIRIADKGANIEDIVSYPLEWDHERKKDYIRGAQAIVNRIRGVCPPLEQWFDQQVENALEKLG